MAMTGASASNGSSGATGTTPATSETTQSYWAQLNPVNNSGAQGFAVLTLAGNQLEVNLAATGLTPNQMHMQHIHGFTTGQPSGTATPADDTNHDGFIETSEAEPVIGNVLLNLSLDPSQAVQQPPGSTNGGTFPTANANGTISYHEVFTFPSEAAAQSAIQNLGNHVVEIHGMNVPAGIDGMTTGGFDAEMPVAGGTLNAVSPGGGALLNAEFGFESHILG